MQGSFLLYSENHIKSGTTNENFRMSAIQYYIHINNQNDIFGVLYIFIIHLFFH